MKLIESLSQALFGRKNPKASDRRAPSTRSGRNRRLKLESLERRELFSVDFLSGFSLGVDTTSPSIRDNAVDSPGNHYIAGTIPNNGTVDFDPSNVRIDGSDLLTSRGGIDGFVAKYGPNNEFLWVRGLGGDAIWDGTTTVGIVNYDRAKNLVVDPAGNVIVTGEFMKNATFGTTNLVAVHPLYVDAFVTKLDANGNFLWAKSWGTSTADFAEDVAVDSNGNITAVGYSLTTGVEIRRFSANGSLQWMKSTSFSQGNTARSVSVDSSDNIIVSGEFTGKVDFDPDPKKTFNVTGAPFMTGTTVTEAANAYVLKLNSSGVFQWVAPLIAKTNVDLQSQIDGDRVDVDASGNIYLAGDYKRQVDVNPSSSIDLRLTATNDQFLLKLTSNGSLAWSQSYAGGSIMDIQVSGNAVVVGGHFNNPLTLPGLSTITPKGVINSAGLYNTDIYFAEFNLNGALTWSSIIGDVAGESLQTFDIASDGTLFVVGSYYGPTLDFDNDPSTPPELQGRTDTGSPRFLAKLRRR